jgi:hypothetical protein
VQIRSEFRDDFVEIEADGEADPDVPLLSVQVRLQTGAGFRGESVVDLTALGLERFLRQLEALERLRAGEARLESIGTGEFVLSIRAADRAGHILVEATINRGFCSNGAFLTNRVAADFQIDPTAFPDILRDFRELADRFAPAS